MDKNNQKNQDSNGLNQNKNEDKLNFTTDMKRLGIMADI